MRNTVAPRSASSLGACSGRFGNSTRAPAEAAPAEAEEAPDAAEAPPAEASEDAPEAAAAGPAGEQAA